MKLALLVTVLIFSACTQPEQPTAKQTPAATCTNPPTPVGALVIEEEVAIKRLAEGTVNRVYVQRCDGTQVAYYQDKNGLKASWE